MARATHLTISTADRMRLDGRCGEDGGEESGDNEVRQEVQVSVTYTLEAGDTNLVRLAEAKALEVKLAHEAVWNRIGAFSSGNGAFSGGAPGRCSGRHESDENPDDEEDEDKEDENDDLDDEPLAGLPHHCDDPFGGGLLAGGAARPHPVGLTGHDSPFPTRSVIPSHNGRPVPAGKPAGNIPNGPEPATDSGADPITGPQKILIRSRAKKAGLTAYALESLVYQQFKVWKVEKLTKEQAASVLDALDRDLKERETQEGNGAHGSAVATRAA